MPCVLFPIQGYVARAQLAHLIALPATEVVTDEEVNHLYRFNPYSIAHFRDRQPPPEWFEPVENCFVVYRHRMRDGFVSEGLIGLLSLVHEPNVQLHEQVYPANVQKLQDHYLHLREQRFPLMIISQKEWQIPEVTPIFRYENIKGEQVEVGLWVHDRPLEIQTDLFLADGHHRWTALQQLYQEGQTRHVLTWLLPPSRVRVQMFYRKIKGDNWSECLASFTGNRTLQVYLPNRTIQHISMTEPVITMPERLERQVHQCGLEIQPVAPDRPPTFYSLADDEILVTFPDVSLNEVWAYARQHGTLPPKTTWFAPKMDMGLIRVPL